VYLFRAMLKLSPPIPNISLNISDILRNTHHIIFCSYKSIVLELQYIITAALKYDAKKCRLRLCFAQWMFLQSKVLHKGFINYPYTKR
jgi:hypothetical protein